MKKLVKWLVPKVYGAYFNIAVYTSPKGIAHRAFEVFCKVRKGKALPFQKPYLEEASLKRVTVGAHELQVYQWPGSGETILLVHGWESNTYRWRNLIPKLRDAGFNILAFDAPGHGLSSGTHLHVPMYTECVDHFISSFSPTALVGHSVGAMTVLYHNHLHPQTSVKKIVSLGAPSEFEGILTHFQSILGFGKRVRKSLEIYIHERFGFYPHEFSVAQMVKDNTKQGFVVHDVGDTVTPYAGSEAIHKNWKNSQFLRTEGLGHSLHQDEVNDTIIRFLKD